MRSDLRELTCDAHEATHRLAPLAALMEGSLSYARYGRLLKGLFIYHAGSLAVLLRAGHELGLDDALLDQARVDRLREDLVSTSAGVPLVAVKAPSSDLSWNVGYAYVVKGSAIGGQILHRKLDALLGSERDGRTFFILSEPEKVAWRRFCKRLDSSALDLVSASEGAHASFRDFSQALAEQCKDVLS